MTETVSEKLAKLPKGEKIQLMFDECMKIMFANPDRLEPLTLLLSRILEIKYEDLVGHIIIETPFFQNKALGKKKTERDIVVRWNSCPVDTKILIEINTNKYDSVLNKGLYYFHQLFGSGLKEGKFYDKVDNAMLINFNTFYSDTSNKELFDYYFLRNIHGTLYTEKEKILNINIEGCYQAWYNNNVPSFKNSYQKDLFYLCAAMYTKKNNEFLKIIDEINIGDDVKSIIKEVSRDMNNDSDLRIKYYNWEEENKLMRDSIIHEVRTKSSEATRREMIINLYKNGVSLELISKSANLTKEEVLKIISEQ